jgi:4-oxalocrotonate tautomerase
MPLVEIKVFERELSPGQTRTLIEQVTDVIAGIAGDHLRPATWVVVDEVKSGNWGVGGKALGLDDVRALAAGRGAERR